MSNEEIEAKLKDLIYDEATEGWRGINADLIESFKRGQQDVRDRTVGPIGMRCEIPAKEIKDLLIATEEIMCKQDHFNLTIIEAYKRGQKSRNIEVNIKPGIRASYEL